MHDPRVAAHVHAQRQHAMHAGPAGCAVRARCATAAGRGGASTIVAAAVDDHHVRYEVVLQQAQELGGRG